MRRGILLALSAWVLIASMGMLWSRDALAEEGLTRIAENVYSYIDVKQSGPQNSFGANAGIIIGRDGIVVVDTLISSKQALKFIKDIRAVSDKPIRYVVNTHYHLDHSFGNSDFQKLGAVIIAHLNDRNNALRGSEDALKSSKAYGLTEQDMEGTSIAYPSLVFRDRMEIDLGDQRIELIYTKPSHTTGSILVHLPDQKVLFAGDVLFTNYHPFMGEGDISNWLRVLDTIMAMDVDKIIPGHGPLSTKKDIQDMKKYLTAFDRKARQLSRRSKDADRIASDLKQAMPQRAEGEWLIKANVQMKYLKP